MYGLQDGLGHPSNVEALAAHYIEDIRSAQPGGPYYLGGICSGGVVAFEMAQQLIRTGEQVALLALVEPATLSLRATYLDLFIEIWNRWTQHVGGQSPSISGLAFAEKVMFLRLRKKVVANIWALKRYSPQSYPGHLHLFLTRESLARSHPLGWCEYARDGADIHEIPGTHRSITGDRVPIEEAQMEVLATALRRLIDQAPWGAQRTMP
jgi:thioesterase domain-containing protein